MVCTVLLCLAAAHDPFQCSAKPESPSWAHMQQLAMPTSTPARMAPALDSLAMTGIVAARQVCLEKVCCLVTSPQVGSFALGQHQQSSVEFA